MIAHLQFLTSITIVFHCVIMSTISYLPPPLPSPPSSPPPLPSPDDDEIRLRNLLTDSRDQCREFALNDATDDDQLIDALYLIDARKLCLASYLWDCDANSKEAIDLLESIVGLGTTDVDERKITKIDRQSSQYAYSCELLCFILANQCCCQSNNDIDEKKKTKRAFQVAKLASSSQFDTPFAQFLTFIDRLWHSDEKSSYETILMKNVLSFGFQIATKVSGSWGPCFTLPINHLQRSAYDGLVEAQELLVLFWSHSAVTSERKLATFIAWSFKDSTIDRLLSRCQKSISEFSYTIDKVLELTEFDSTNDALWIRRLRRQSRAQIQHRLSNFYCYNCLVLDCSLNDCSEPERIQCPTCGIVGYCSLTCRYEHWQSTHQYWCRETPKDCDVIAFDHVPKSMMTANNVN
jgi:hypothetical protein